MAHPRPSKSRRDPSYLSAFSDWGRTFEMETRMIIAWLWAPLKNGLECLLRFSLRSNATITILSRSPGRARGNIPAPPHANDDVGPSPALSSAPVPIHAARRMPRKFLAARHGDE